MHPLSYREPPALGGHGSLRRWEELSVAGRSWESPALGGAGRRWEELGGAGRSWAELGGAGRSWEALGGAGRSWAELGGAGRRWEALGGAGSCNHHSLFVSGLQAERMHAVIFHRDDVTLCYRRVRV